jgi:GxxExxY protein
MKIRNEEEVRVLCDRIRQTAFDLHVFLKHGHLEKAYENGLANRLRKAGLRVEQQKNASGN